MQIKSVLRKLCDPDGDWWFSIYFVFYFGFACWLVFGVASELVQILGLWFVASFVWYSIEEDVRQFFSNTKYRKRVVQQKFFVDIRDIWDALFVLIIIVVMVLGSIHGFSQEGWMLITQDGASIVIAVFAFFFFWCLAVTWLGYTVANWLEERWYDVGWFLYGDNPHMQ